MNFFKRAFLSVTKRKGKSLILILSMTAVALFILSGFTIHTAVDRTQESVQSHIGANVTLEFDAEKAMAKYQASNPGQSGGIRGECIPLAAAEQVAENEHVKGYNFTLSSGGVADNFKPLYDEAAQKQLHDTMVSMGKNYEAPNLNIMGALDTSLLSAFVSGEYDLLKGRHISKEDAGKNYVLVEETLADTNHLDIGDSIELHWHKDASKKLKLMIAGIYRAPAVDEITAKYAVKNPVNNLIVSYTEAGVLGDAQVEEVDSVTYYLDSPDSITDFSQSVKDYVDMEVFKLTTDEEAYKGITGPLENVSTFTTGLTIVLAAAACIILGLILLLSMNSRKPEFGILLAVGEQRKKIISQILLETAIMTGLALAVAIPLSGHTAELMGKRLLQNEMRNIQQQNQSGDAGQMTVVSSAMGANSNNVLDEQTMNEIDITVSSGDYVNFLLAYSLVLLIAIILPLASVLRLNPRIILLKQG